MKRYMRLAVAFLAFAFVACTAKAEGATPGAASGGRRNTIPKIEIAFLNHPPVIAALREVDALLASYGDKISVVRYDLETDQGAAFEKRVRLKGHLPIAIFINGAMEIKLGARTVKFFSFPQGEGTFMVAGGSWTAEDLRQAIDQALGQAK